MRRWRLDAGRTLAEAPTLGKAQYYLLGKAGRVERLYAESATSIQAAPAGAERAFDRLGDGVGELHRLSFVVMGRQLMRRHVVERGSSPTQDQSGVELDGLTQLTPQEHPTEAEVREALALHESGGRGLEEERQAKIDRMAESAGPGARALVRGLAERIVRHDDELAAAMLSCLRSLAEVHRSRGGSDTLRAATEAIALAARLVALERGAVGPAPPAPGDETTRTLIDSLDDLRVRLRSAADAQDDSDSMSGSDTGRSYRRAAELLRVAVQYLLMERSG